MGSKILYVFTKEYRDNVRFYELLYKMCDKVKLKCQSESVDDKIARLKSSGYVSNFHMTVNL